MDTGSYALGSYPPKKAVAGVAPPQDADGPAGACLPWESAGVWIPLGFPLLSVNSEKENLEMDEQKEREL